MKKVLSALISIGLLASLTGCTIQIPATSDSNPSVATDTNSTHESDITPDEALTSEPEPQQENVVLYDENGIKISYRSIEEGFLGKEMNLEIQNTTQINYTIQARDMSVNGYMLDPIFSCDIAAGKRANDYITLPSYELEDNGITDIESVELKFYFFNSDDWSDNMETGPITINFS